MLVDLANSGFRGCGAGCGDSLVNVYTKIEVICISPSPIKGQ